MGDKFWFCAIDDSKMRVVKSTCKGLQVISWHALSEFYAVPARFWSVEKLSLVSSQVSYDIAVSSFVM